MPVRKLSVQTTAFLAALTAAASLRAENPPAPPAAAAAPAPPSATNAAGAKPAAASPPAAPSGGASSAPAASPAAPAPNASPAPSVSGHDLALSVQRATLENGLRVVMNVDHTSPTVAVAVTYDVGARNEEKGRSGFAHLFEHMMFEGSANVPKGEHFRLVSAHGGTLNGTTSNDRTNYFETLPSNELALALWLEADRMKSLDVSQENFENQRRVVEEEYRMRVSNVAYAPAEIKLSELVFQGYWPYEHDAIGSMEDLDAAKLEWVRAFHDSWYAPNLAVLSIAGDFDPDEAMSLVHKYFDPAKRQDNVVAYDPPPAPEQTEPRTASLDDPHAKTPLFFEAWSGPPVREPDHYALELAISVLTDGESSRLHQKLVRDRALAQQVEGWTEDHRGPDLIGLRVQLPEKVKLAEVEKVVDAEVARLAKEGPTDAEMAKVRNRTEAAFLFGLQSNLNRATKLGSYELFFGDARLLNSEPGRYLAVTKDDIKRVVAKYMAASRKNLVEVTPLGAPSGSKAGVAAAAPSGTAAEAGTRGERAKAGKDAVGTMKGAKPGVRPGVIPDDKEIEGGRHKPRHKKDQDKEKGGR